MSGIVSYGAYVPYFRLRRAVIGAATRAGELPGTRAVASYDEDTTTMAVEAARLALASAPAGSSPRSVLFSTALPAYLDKTNATAVHAALDLDPDVFATDMIGSVRSGVGALRSALASSEPALVALADVRTGLPGSVEERDGGDAAAAFLTGHENVIAELVGTASSTGEFLDRWRVPGEVFSRVWEDRFGEHAYAPHVDEALRGLKEMGVAPEALDHVVVAGLHGKAVRNAAKALGARPEALAASLAPLIGNCGLASPGLQLAEVLDRAEPGQLIAVLVLADGCDILVFRATPALAAYRRTSTVAAQIASGRDDLDYTTFLSWRGMLRREPPRRPDPLPPAGPPSLRAESWKFAFVASRCADCGTRHLPPARVCLECRSTDRMERVPLSGTRATVATHTIDRLAYSESPPVVVGVLDFDGGGRYPCELTDVDADQLSIGDRVEMTFRKMYTAGGVHNYFWKARPLREGA